MLKEDLLHFIWKHRFLPLKELKTVTGQPLEVIDPGLHNIDAGPDFLNAKVKIGSTVWVGNVEIHINAGDWYLHRHHKNPVYDSVVLHVVLEGEQEVKNSRGESIPQLIIQIPDYLQERYKYLIKVNKELIPCRSSFPHLSRLEILSWMERLLVERLEERYNRIQGYFKDSEYNWNTVFFITLARAFGFGKNSYAFEWWGKNLPYAQLIKHSSNLFEIEAIFFGTAGLLQKESMPEHFWNKSIDGAQYYDALLQEYVYLKHKYGLKEMDFTIWKYLRTRPYNFPHVRIAQLAALYRLFSYKVGDLLEGKIDFVPELKSLKFTRYWSSHYCFSSPVESQLFKLTDRSLQLLEMNCIIPLIYALGKYKGEEDHMQLAIDKLNKLKPESNQIIRIWMESGIEVKTAADSQALLQLQRQYCDRKDCLRCRFGMEYLRCK